MLFSFRNMNFKLDGQLLNSWQCYWQTKGNSFIVGNYTYTPTCRSQSVTTFWFAYLLGDLLKKKFNNTLFNFHGRVKVNLYLSSKCMNSHCVGHLTGCSGADLHNSLTSASSTSSEHFPHKIEKMPNISDKAAAFHSHKHTSWRDWLFWSSFSPKHRWKHPASFASDFKPPGVPRIFWRWAWVLVLFLYWFLLQENLNTLSSFAHLAS